MRFIELVIIICIAVASLFTAQGNCGPGHAEPATPGTSMGSEEPLDNTGVDEILWRGGTLSWMRSGSESSSLPRSSLTTTSPSAPTKKYTGIGLEKSVRNYIKGKDRKAAESVLLGFLKSKNPKIQAMGIIGIKECYRGVDYEDYPPHIKELFRKTPLNDASTFIMGLVAISSLGDDNDDDDHLPW